MSTFATFASISTSLTPLGDESASSWVMLLPAGTFRGRDGRGPFVTGDEAAMRAIVEATLTRAGATEIMVDYDHQSVFSAVPGVGGRAPAAGWIKDFEVRPDGIWGRVEWTAAATAAIRAGEYRYLSPYFNFDKAGKVGLIASAGLTNVPALDLAGGIAARAIGDHTMDKILAALGLANDAGEDAAVSAIAALKAGMAAMSTIAVAAGLTDKASAEDVVAAIRGKADPGQFVPMSQFQAVQTELNKLTGTLADDKARAAVDEAMAAGKVAPAAKDWAMTYARANPAGFAAFVAAQPKIVDPQATRRGNPGGADDGLTDSDYAAMRALGISEDDYKKAKKVDKAC